MPESNLIYDVGMHNGSDTAFYLSRGFRVVAIEADPDLAERGRQRFHEAIAQHQLEILNVAIADRPGEAEFWICDQNSEWNSFDPEVAGRNGAPHHAIRVETRTFASILESCGDPHYVKIDIEGGDRDCLADLRSFPSSRLPRFISWENELVFDDAGRPEIGGLVRLAHEIGFARFKLIDQASYWPLPSPRTPRKVVDALVWRALMFKHPRLPRPARKVLSGLTYRSQLGRKWGWTFTMGASGPWGDQLPGSWLTYAEAVDAHQRAIRDHFSNGKRSASTFWCDWHAAR